MHLNLYDRNLITVALGLYRYTLDDDDPYTATRVDALAVRVRVSPRPRPRQPVPFLATVPARLVLVTFGVVLASAVLAVDVLLLLMRSAAQRLTRSLSYLDRDCGAAPAPAEGKHHVDDDAM